jgi:hypothetical protein
MDHTQHRRGRYLHNTQQTQEMNVSALTGICTCSPSNQASACLHLRPHGHWDWHVFSFREKFLLYCRLRLCILYIKMNCTLLVCACTSLEVLLHEYHLALVCVLLTNNEVNLSLIWDVKLSKLTSNIIELSQWHEGGFVWFCLQTLVANVCCYPEHQTSNMSSMC